MSRVLYTRDIHNIKSRPERAAQRFFSGVLEGFHFQSSSKLPLIIFSILSESSPNSFLSMTDVSIGS